MLAQIDKVPPVLLWQLAVLIAALIAIGAGATTIFSNLRKTKVTAELNPPFPESIETREQASYVTEKVCAERHSTFCQRMENITSEIRSIWERIGKDRVDLENMARTRSAGLYQRIDEVRRELSTEQQAMRAEMQQGFKDIERAIGQLEGKISRDR
jgi:hypothetical protein